ncbi:hypothetical protein N7449_008709 [Penicillium cf. viridicatum]|uniref:Profilin n=1 Tax=Penicillium cf. viridicatum TaxID=2972119 RepID=A0A9W9JAL5_9EURO|nr:hypothetical protein N7449_008709 [Penicillium cf. viridicatum]
MSWQGWVDQTLVGSKKIDKAAIFSAAGDALLATTAGFNVQLGEVQYMLRGFEDSIPLYSGGLYVAGEKLMVTKADEQSIYAEKLSHIILRQCNRERLQVLLDSWQII